MTCTFDDSNGIENFFWQTAGIHCVGDVEHHFESVFGTEENSSALLHLRGRGFKGTRLNFFLCPSPTRTTLALQFEGVDGIFVNVQYGG